MPTSSGSAQERVLAAQRRIDTCGRPEVWITLRPSHAVLAEARVVDQRSRQGESLPLAGCLLAVKDNIDVAGLPTTAGCPPFAYVPSATAPVIQRLIDAGALVLGKTNLDQFATGLVGIRSPYGAVRSAWDPAKVAGGSSAGSAVAVALELADIGIGTDTAGSGRVPAAFNRIIGFKPTRGLLPLTGVVPASRSYDCVTVLTRTLALGQRALSVMAGPDAHDPGSRAWPDLVRLAAPQPARLAVPRDGDLSPLSAAARSAFDAAVETFNAAGVQTTVIDASPFLEAAKLLYDGALVAERYAAVGEFISRHRDDVDPSVATIILDAGHIAAHQLVSHQAAVEESKAIAAAALSGHDALLLPTAPEHPSIAAVRHDPLGTNRHLGKYTNFVNVLDMAALAVPAGEADGGPFGVSVVTRAFDDQIALDLAALLLNEPAPPPYGDTTVHVMVPSTHPHSTLREQLIAHGGRLLQEGQRPPGAATAQSRRTAHRESARPPTDADHWAVSIGGLGRLLVDLPMRATLEHVPWPDGSPAVFLAAAPDADLITAMPASGPGRRDS
ncbi:allophanate hydrolase [Streptomyces sp. NPDC058466]|uniref:allophanate hydrolase n=1 Tax=Streptomyces sp. NPDC058466 TaxID=3346512 RepID=UPI00364D47C1